MKIDIDVSGTERVRGMLARIGARMSADALAGAAVEIEDYIANESGKHTKSGALVQSVFKKRLPSGGWEIGHDLRRAPHAVFVHWGTKAHLIKPIDGGVYKSFKDADGKTVKKGIAKGGRGRTMLRWAGGGKFSFAKIVHHPGNKPDKWIERAASLAPMTFERHVSAKLRELQQS